MGRNPSPKHVVKPSATTADTNSRSIGRDVTQKAAALPFCATLGATSSCELPQGVEKKLTARIVTALRNIYVPIHRSSMSQKSVIRLGGRLMPSPPLVLLQLR